MKLYKSVVVVSFTDASNSDGEFILISSMDDYYVMFK